MLVRHSTWYVLASAASAAFGLASVMILTRLVAKPEYGVFVLGAAAAGLVNALFFSWIRISFTRLHAEGAHVDARPAALRSWAWSSLAVVLLAPGMLLLLPAGAVAGVMALALSLSAFELTQDAMRARLAASRVLASTCVRAGLTLALSAGAAMAGCGGAGLLLAMGLGFFAALAVFWRPTWAGTARRSDAAQMSELAALGLPLAGSGLVAALASYIDRFSVASLQGVSASGEYGASADLVRQIMVPPAMAIGAAVLPLAIRSYAAGGIEAARPDLRRSLELLVGVAAPAAVGLAIVSPNISVLVLGPAFQQAALQIIPLLAGAALLNVVSQGYLQVGFLLAKRPALTTVQVFCVLVANLSAAMLLIPRFGLSGAAMAVLVGEAVGVGVGTVMTRGSMPLPFPAWALVRVAVATVCCGVAAAGVAGAFEPDDPLGLAAVVAAGVVTYAVAGFGLDIMDARRLTIAWVLQRWRPSC